MVRWLVRAHAQLDHLSVGAGKGIDGLGVIHKAGAEMSYTPLKARMISIPALMLAPVFRPPP